MKEKRIDKAVNLLIILLLAAGVFNITTASAQAATIEPSCAYIVEE